MHVDFAYTYIKLCGFKDSHGIALCMWLGCGLQVMLVGKKNPKLMYLMSSVLLELQEIRYSAAGV